MAGHHRGRPAPAATPRTTPRAPGRPRSPVHGRTSCSTRGRSGSRSGVSWMLCSGGSWPRDRDAPIVVIVSDPKSAEWLGGDTTSASRRLVRVFDAYDAWDLSPLVQWTTPPGRRPARLPGCRSERRPRDREHGHSWLSRMRDLGARDVRIVANGAPEVVDTVSVASPPYLAYVGRIHERVDCALLAAVAAAFPDVKLRLAGPIEGRPDGWDELVARPNVSVEGALATGAAREFIAASAALLVPHVASDYTRSQDAMKAWDALASGTPVRLDRGAPGGRLATRYRGRGGRHARHSSARSPTCWPASPRVAEHDGWRWRGPTIGRRARRVLADSIRERARHHDQRPPCRSSCTTVPKDIEACLAAVAAQQRPAGQRRHPRQRLERRRRGDRPAGHARRPDRRRPGNIGFAAGHNLAIATPGDLHVVLNPDCRWPPYLARAVPALDADPSAGS